MQSIMIFPTSWEITTYIVKIIEQWSVSFPLQFCSFKSVDIVMTGNEYICHTAYNSWCTFQGPKMTTLLYIPQRVWSSYSSEILLKNSLPDISEFHIRSHVKTKWHHTNREGQWVWYRFFPRNSTTNSLARQWIFPELHS